MGELENMLVRARARGSAIAAFNIVDGNSMRAILQVASSSGQPVVVQLSVRVAEFWGFQHVVDCFRRLRDETGADAVLHLDHCVSPETAIKCLSAGWDSVLLDTSTLTFAEAVGTTRRVIGEAKELGCDVEGEFEPIRRFDDREPGRRTGEIARYVEFVEATGVICVAPRLGTAHGQLADMADVDVEYARALGSAIGVPLVLHGGSGTDTAVLRALIAAGVAKVNVSTALKAVYRRAWEADVGKAGSFEPLRLLEGVQGGVQSVGQEWIDRLRNAA